LLERPASAVNISRAYALFTGVVSALHRLARYRKLFKSRKGKGSRRTMRWRRHGSGKSAGKDFLEAQSALGTMYTKGQGVPRDFVQAQMWLSSALAYGDADAQKRLDSVAWRMSPTEIAEAQRLAKEWKPKGRD